MDTMDIDDPNERPTLPSPVVPAADDAVDRAIAMRAFDTQAEVFFAFTAPMTEADDLAAWWVEQRRRTLVGWVAAAMALCAGVLAAGFLSVAV